MFKYIRPVLGKVLLTVDRLTSPKPLTRPTENQEQIDHETQKYSLYQFESCPFCIKVRRAAKQMNLKIQYRDARNTEQFRDELLKNGGKLQVPCLRIEKEDGKIDWMYESSDIIRFLKERYAE